jgi:hypothetical protein
VSKDGAGPTIAFVSGATVVVAIDKLTLLGQQDYDTRAAPVADRHHPVFDATIET